jgi:hypothetical protein
MEINRHFHVPAPLSQRKRLRYQLDRIGGWMDTRAHLFLESNPGRPAHSLVIHRALLAPPSIVGNDKLPVQNWLHWHHVHTNVNENPSIGPKVSKTLKEHTGGRYDLVCLTVSFLRLKKFGPRLFLRTSLLWRKLDADEVKKSFPCA